MPEQQKTTRLLLLTGILILPVALAFYIGASIAASGYDHIAETVSQLGVSGRAHPEIINAGFIVVGILVNTFACGFYRLLGSRKHAGVIRALLAICGTGIILVGIFHADRKGLDIVTTGGTMHMLFALVAGVAFIAGTLVFAKTVQNDTNWRGWARFSVIIVALSALLLIIFVTDLLDPIEGVVQRSFIATALLWVEAVSIRSLRIPT